MIICPIFLRCVQYSARNTKIIADSIWSLPFDTAVCLDWVGRTLSLFPFLSPPQWPWTQRVCGWDAPSCAHRTSTVSSCAFCEHRGSHSWPPVFLSLFNLARRDLTGGANLGARPPAAGSLHRAGCEDGRAGSRQDPFISSPPLSLGRCSILGPGLGGSRSVIRAPLGDRSC